MPLTPALSSVSSQVSQVPQGVRPPAQLVEVPAMPTHSATGPPCGCTSTTVQPPEAAGSYTRPSVSGTGCGQLERGPLSSWLLTSRVTSRGPGKVAVPSWLEGVDSPDSSVVTPVRVMIRYEKPA